MTWPAIVPLEARRTGIVCFGLRADRVHRQPWAVALGLARGLEKAGHTGIIFTDAADPPEKAGCALIAVRRLFAERRLSPELLEALRHWAPERVILVAGPLELARLATGAFDGAPPVSILLASPRSAPWPLLRLGAAALWRERDLALLPVVNALLPGILMRRGFARSGARGTLFSSHAAQQAYRRAGLPEGPVVVPQAAGPVTTRPVDLETRFRIAYFGPPLALRGAWLALDAFEKASARGLDAELMLLIRPDAPSSLIDAFEARLAASPARDRIVYELAMHPRPVLEQKLATAHAFLLPFVLPVSDVPLVVIEAGLSGRPLITLDAPGVAEITRAMGGIIAPSPAGLSDALFEAQRRLASWQLPDPGAWTDWSRAVQPLLAPVAPAPCSLAMIAICGVDGSGKTTIADMLAARLGASGGRPVRRVWSRFRNYLSKPLLALARLTGHNRKEEWEGQRVGYHEFAPSRLLSLSFLVLQTIDQLIDIRLRFARRRELLIADRCVVDTLVDLAIDTDRDAIVFGPIARLLLARLPGPLLIVVLRRSPAMIGRSRADALLDRNFARRRVLYDKLAARFGFHILVNDGTVDEALDRIEALATEDASAWQPADRAEA